MKPKNYKQSFFKYQIKQNKKEFKEFVNMISNVEKYFVENDKIK